MPLARSVKDSRSSWRVEPMQVLSVNLAASPSNLPGSRTPTGIRKTAVTHPVRIHSLGLENDSICSTRHHGGPDQAVYLYGQPDYEWWSNEFGCALEPGTFGENLTISDLMSADHNVGDRFHIGEVILEVTAPRIPCGTLAKRMNDARFPERFREAERPGLYCRVIREGFVRAGDAVSITRTTGPIVPAVELFRSFYRAEESEETIRWHLSAPIAARARKMKEDELQKRSGV
jgi:MOSC domain-containing protein YiiM